MARTEQAQVIREISADEPMSDLINEAKGLTWDHSREHAMIETDDGRLLMIRGGSHGINLDHTISKAIGADFLSIQFESKFIRVQKLIFHVHPLPTGPSDDDLFVLKLLRQRTSMLYEISGPRGGTRIRPKGGK